MAKVTSKLQLTLPKAVADAHAVRPGTEVQFESAVDCIRLLIGKPRPRLSKDEKLRLFREARERQTARNRRFTCVEAPRDRGWRREDAYERGRTR
ncbi:MAG: AbrB/MazE/SpoVT family DNA-binding domain-containing protein [Verrucomicrobia bacterium]|nr:AbrB/MazE/SpoVT family DNA-binding domain-containing protein [Verrucomicrobiota bacterium]